MLVLCVGWLAGCAGEPERASSETRLASLSDAARSALAEGQQALDERRYADGLGAITRLDSLAPDLPEAALLHGRLLAAMGRRSDAAFAYEQALDRDSTLEGVRHNLGNLAFEDQRYADAARWYRAEAERFNTPRPWHGLGGSYTALGRADSVRIAFEHALALDPDYDPARRSLAEWYEADGDPDAALDLLRPLLDRHPDDLDLITQVGLLHARTERRDEAEPLLRQAIEAEPWNYAAMLALAQVLRQQEEGTEADALFEQATAVREAQAVVERLERQVRAAPSDLRRRVALADAYRQTGRFRDALATYQAALGQRPDNASLLTNAGVLRLQLGDTQAGLDLLGQAVAADPTFGPAWVNLWMHYGRTGDLQRAEAAFDEAQRYAPDHPAVQAFLRQRAAAGVE
ncbi:MAG: tetratricopeptide repeat protein [Bacteroidota bacterium]